MNACGKSLASRPNVNLYHIWKTVRWIFSVHEISWSNIYLDFQHRFHSVWVRFIKYDFASWCNWTLLCVWQALKLWLKFRLKHWSVVAFLSLFTLSMMIYTLPPSPSDRSDVHPWATRNNKPSRLLARRSLRPHLPLHSRSRSEVKDSTKHLLMVNHQQLSFSSGKTAEENSNKPTIHLLRSRLDPALPQSAKMQSLHPNSTTCRHKCTPDGAEAKGLARRVVKLKQVPTKEKARERQSELFERKEPQSGMRASITDWCKTVPDETESLPWLSDDDVQKMKLLSRGVVISKSRLSGHGQVLQVGLNGTNGIFAGTEHTKHCQTGGCALIKRPGDWFEVFAFHLDRVLGLNRSLPVVLRTFHCEILPYKYTNGTPRPVVWWDPNIQHLSDADNDQNSLSLTWPQYQTALQSRCGSQVPLNFTNCVGVHHSEWGRLALFDFLLQVRDTAIADLDYYWFNV